MKAGTIEIELLANMARLMKDMEDAKRVVGGAMDSIDRSVGLAKKALASFGVAVSMTAVVMFAKSIHAGVDALNDLSDATGASIAKLSGLQDLAMRNAHAWESVGTTVMRVNKVLADAKPGSGADLALKAIGLRAAELRALDPADAVTKIAIALDRYANDGNKARVVQELFSKSAREMAPLLKDLAEQGRLNATVTTQQAEEAEAFTKQLGALRAEVTEVSRGLMFDLLPPLTRILKNFREIKELGSLDLILRDAARALFTGDPRMTGDHAADLEAQRKELARLRNQQRFADSKGLPTRDIQDEINLTLRYIEVLKVKQRTEILQGLPSGYEGDMQSRRLERAKGTVGNLPDEAAIKAAAKAVEEQRKLIAELNGLSGDFAKDWDSLNAQYKRGELSMEGLLRAQEALLAKQPAIRKAREDEIRINKQWQEQWEQTQKEREDAEKRDYDIRTKFSLAITAQETAIRETNDQLELERKLIGASDKERTIAIEHLRIEQQLRRSIREMEISLAFDKDQLDVEKRRLQDQAERQKAHAAEKAALQEQLDMIGSIERTAHDVWTNIWEGGSNAFKKLGQMLKASVLDLLYQMTIKKWVIQIAAQFTGGGNAGFLGQLGSMFGGGGSAGGGGFLNQVGSLFNMGGGGSGGGGFLNTVSQLFGGGSSGGGAGMAIGGLASAAGAASALAGGGGIGAGLASAASMGVGGAAAGMGAAAAIPYIGWAIALASLIAGAAGGGETRSGATYRNGAFAHGPSGGQINGAQDATTATMQFINSALKSMGSTAQISNFISALESSQKGKGFVYAGGTLSTGQSFGEWDESLGRMNRRGNKSPEEASRQYAEELKQAAIEALQAADVPGILGDYLRSLGHAAFLSQGEVEAAYARITKALAEKAQLEARLAELTTKAVDNLAKTREEELKAIDESNRSLLKQVHAQEDMNKAEAELIAAYGRESAALQSSIEAHKAFAAELRKFRDGLLLGDMSPLTRQAKLGEAASQYSTLFGKAMGGDVTAQAGFTDQASAYLDAALRGARSKAEYDAIFATVATNTLQLADQADAQATAEQQQMDLMRQQLEQLGLLNQTALQTLTFQEAMAAYEESKAAVEAAKAAAAAEAARRQVELAKPDPFIDMFRAKLAGMSSGGEVYANWWRDVMTDPTGQSSREIEKFNALTEGAKKYIDPTGQWIMNLADVEGFRRLWRNAGLYGGAEGINDGSAAAAAASAADGAAGVGAGIGSFAAGGYHAGGLRVVGEDGPELEWTGPSYIFNASRTAEIMRGGGGGYDMAVMASCIENLTTEVRHLRSEAAATAKHASESKMSLREMERFGVYVRNAPDGEPLEVDQV